MAMYTLLRNKPKPTHADIDEAIQGNLCRCTGYRPILEAYYSFVVDDESGAVRAPPLPEKQQQNGSGICSLGAACCKNRLGCDEQLQIKVREARRG